MKNLDIYSSKVMNWSKPMVEFGTSFLLPNTLTGFIRYSPNIVKSLKIIGGE